MNAERLGLINAERIFQDQSKTVAVTIRIPADIERCAVEYARHHDLRTRNAAFNVALDAFFCDPRTPAQIAADHFCEEVLDTQASDRP